MVIALRLRPLQSIPRSLPLRQSRLKVPLRRKTLQKVIASSSPAMAEAAAQKEEPSAEAQRPKLTAAEFRGYNHVADMMEQYVGGRDPTQRTRD